MDEVRLQVYPVVLGAGDRLFGGTQDKLELHLVESRPFERRVNMTYAPALADVAVGSAAILWRWSVGLTPLLVVPAAAVPAGCWPPAGNAKA